ncbi:response regulator transcription factor [Alkalicoccus luteus]|uniref:Response regulator transcription factor n=1 Tax=Alkalicoccus luteus TaxID=1237094 RepID=A0A969TV92_9BACI|nr:response regulator transcription factor [Alkalicoccus luteus]NJP37746.1 response regulator transcription factor [Alkalicoccus luteus]
MNTILIVDDEPQMLELITDCLQLLPVEVQTEHDSAAARKRLQTESFDLVMLDVMMPSPDGWELLKETAGLPSPPSVIMLTALGDNDQVVRGLQHGADDYVTKPFEPAILAARVEAVLRRKRPHSGSTISCNGLTVDSVRRQAAFEGSCLSLTKKEFDLVALLVKRPGQVFTRQQLLDEIDDHASAASDRTVDTHMKNIREKIRRAGGSSSLIETVWGIGYRLGNRK